MCVALQDYLGDAIYWLFIYILVILRFGDLHDSASSGRLSTCHNHYVNCELNDILCVNIIGDIFFCTGNCTQGLRLSMHVLLSYMPSPLVCKYYNIMYLHSSYSIKSN